MSSYPVTQLNPHDPSFAHLWNLRRPPTTLFAKGKPEALELLGRLPERGLAIVGTRENQPRSEQMVRDIVSDLRDFNLVILSGLARGIDTIAHETALSYGLPTIAILGCGINVTYPPENDSLQLEILKSGGLIVSEFPPDAEPRPSYFIERNRLIAGWSRATWVVEAGFRSGALNTAKWARGEERICFATPCYPGDLHLAGNQVLLDRDCAMPLWSSDSLVFAWLELASFLAERRPRRRARPLEVMNDIQLLTQEVERASTAQGGIPITDLRAWSHRKKWEAERFIRALREASDRGQVINWNGVLTYRIH